MEARHLRYALALAEAEHFGRAAHTLGIAQPPLSKQIADLEREVGVRLFDRTRRGVFPTAAGEAFLTRARRALDEMAAATIDAGRAARGETGRLRLGFIASSLLDPLPGVLSRFGRERPDVRLALHEMSSSRSTAALVAGELDVAITLGPPRGAGAEHLTAVPIGHDHLVVVVSATHPYAGRPSVTVEQLRQQPLIVAPGEDEPAITAGLRTLLGENSPALLGATVARDIHTIIGLAASGIGVGLGPSRMLSAPRPGTWFCDVSPRTPLPDLVLSFTTHDTSPALHASHFAVVAVRTLPRAPVVAGAPPFRCRGWLSSHQNPPARSVSGTLSRDRCVAHVAGTAWGTHRSRKGRRVRHATRLAQRECGGTRVFFRAPRGTGSDAGRQAKRQRSLGVWRGLPAGAALLGHAGSGKMNLILIFAPQAARHSSRGRQGRGLGSFPGEFKRLRERRCWATPGAGKRSGFELCGRSAG
ncbi:LysR family transcriptional regulator [Catenuloplanes japonicus]|uniref:LysR substrate-binding domain-containing protein n=1 Tax=Catenuloplanes japonicus TaxID=33876 RepID=UPI000B10EC4B|nr:LysR substrate-binding domain-containing protein [Catenuloplanes japonicus]